MSLKVNFYPLHFILCLLAIISMVIVFSDTVYSYIAENIYLNSFIIILFIICMLWVLGVLSYYDRSSRVLNKLLSTINPAVAQDKNDTASKLRKQSLYVASSIGGTLFDTPVFSKAVVASIRSGKLSISLSETDMIVDAVKDNGNRVLGLVKFLTGIFVTLGLLGTFVGLLKTIDGVGSALGSLSNAQNMDILGFVGLLSTPLQGMAMAFSASLFGIGSALMGSYGLYVATSRLASFVHKFKNFLTASSVTALSDPSKIEAKDILISLEDSFNRLYMGLAERLDVVSDGVLGMSKSVLRAQERQEKILKVVLQNFATMEEMWSKFIQSTEYLKKLNTISSDIFLIVSKNREELIDYFNKAIVSRLDTINEGVDANVRASVRILDVERENFDISKETLMAIANLGSVTSKVLDVSYEGVNLSREGLGKIDVSNEISRDAVNLSNVSNEIAIDILGVSNSHLETSAVARDVLLGSLDEHKRSNDISIDILDTERESNNLSNSIIREISSSNGLLNTVIDETVNGNGLLNTAISEVINGNGLSNAILNETVDGNGLLNTAISEVINGNGLSSAILNETINGNGLLNTAISEIINNNGLSDNILNELSNSNSLSNAILNEAINSNGLLNTVIDESINSNNLSNAILSETDALNRVSENILGQVAISNSLLEAVSSNVVGSADLVINSIYEGVNQLSGVINANTELMNNGLNGIFAYYENMGAQFNELLNASYQSLEAINSMNASVAESTMATYSTNEAMTSLYQVVVDAMGNFSSMSYSVTENMDLLKSAFEEFGSRFIDVVSSLGNSVEVIYNATEVGRQLDETVYQLNGLMDALIPNVIDLIDSSNRQADSVNVFMDNLSTVVEFTGSTAETLDGLYNAFVNNSSNLESLLGEFYSINAQSYGEMNDNLSEILSYLVNFDNQNFNLLNGMESLVDSFDGMRSDLSENISAVVQSIDDSLVNTLEAFDYISDNMRNIGGLVDRVDSFLDRSEISQMEGFELIRGDLQAISEGQREFLNILEDNLNDIAGNVQVSSDQLISTLSELQNLSDIQTDRLLAAEENIRYFSENGVDLVDSLSAQCKDLQEVITDLSDNFAVISTGIDNVSNAILTQTGIMEEQAIIMDNNIGTTNSIIDALNEFSSANVDLVDLADSIRETSQVILGLEDSLELLDGSINKLESLTADQDSIYSELANNLIDDVNALSNVINRMSDSVAGFDVNKLHEELVVLNNHVNDFTGLLENSVNRNHEDVLEMIDEIGRDVSDIRENLSGNLSQKTLNTLVDIAQDNQDMLERFSEIIPDINDLIRVLSSNTGASGTSNRAILESLETLRKEYDNGNMRLDVIANAMDSLITEMLNSRDVTQSILEMIAKINGYNISGN